MSSPLNCFLRHAAPRCRVVFIFVLAALLSGAARAQDAGTTPANILKISPGARNAAMGGTGATETGAAALYWNPAGLAETNGGELSFTHAAWLEDIAFQHAAYAQRFVNGSAVGLSASFLSMSPISKYDNTGAPQNETYRPSDLMVALTCAGRSYFIPDGLPVGLTARYVSQQIDGASASTLAFDAGLFLHPLLCDTLTRLKAGFSVHNIGAAMKFHRVSYPLPLNARLGISYEARPGLILAADLNRGIDSGLILNTGAEYARAIGGVEVAARAGYRTDTEGLEGLAGFSGGFGVTLTSLGLGLDYAFVPYGILDTAQRVTLNCRF